MCWTRDKKRPFDNFGGKDDGLSRRKSRIGAGIPAPNDDVTMPIGAKKLTEAVFRDTGLDVLLDSLKRDQGTSVSKKTVALVANSLEMTGISVSRIDSILDDEDVRTPHGQEVGQEHGPHSIPSREAADVEIRGDPGEGSDGLDLDVLRDPGEGNRREVRPLPRPPA